MGLDDNQLFGQRPGEGEVSQADVQEESLPGKGPGAGSPHAGRAIVNSKVVGAARGAAMWEMRSERVWNSLLLQNLELR